MIIQYNHQNIEPLFREFLSAENISKITIKNYVCDIRHFIKWWEVRYGVKDVPCPKPHDQQGIPYLTKGCIHEYISSLQKEKREIRVINRVLSSLRRFSQFCIKRGFISQNPLSGLHNKSEKSSFLHPDRVSVPIIQKFKKVLRDRLYNSNINSDDIFFDLQEYISCIYGYVKGNITIQTLIDPLHLMTYKDHLGYEGYKRELIDRKINSLNYFFSWLHDNKNITEHEYVKAKETMNPSSVKKNIYIKEQLQKKLNTWTDKAVYLGIGGFFICTLILFIYIGTYLIRDMRNDNSSFTTTVKHKNGRTIHFQGRLLDEKQTPMIKKQNVTFRLYNVEEGGEVLYSGTCAGTDGIIPDNNGSFSVEIGSDCSMDIIPEDVFFSHALYLGISINKKEEMKPRYALPVTPYAKNSDQVKGLSVGESSESIPYINENGELVIGAESPVIRSTSGQFTMEGNMLLFQTTPGTKGSIFFQPDVGGNTIIGSGNFGIGITNPDATLDVGGDVEISGSLRFSGGDGLITSGSNMGIRIGDKDTSDLILKPQNNISIGTVQKNDKITLGGNAVPSTDKKYTLGNDTYAWNGVFAKEFRGETSGLAEYFDISDSVTQGDIVGISSHGIEKTSDQGTILGVVADEAGFVGNTDKKDTGVLVALMGQMKTHVSTIHGSIRKGDSITVSDIEGYGAGLLQEGQIVGKALEDFNPGGSQEISCPDSAKDKKDTDGNAIQCGVISVMVAVQWDNPDSFDSLINDAKHVSRYLHTTAASNAKMLSPTLTKVIDTISIKTKSFITDSITALDAHILSLQAEHIQSPIIETERIETKEISVDTIESKKDDITIKLGSDKKSSGSDSDNTKKMAQVMITNMENTPVASIDAQGNASLSGSLDAKEVKTGLVDAKHITAEEMLADLIQAQNASIAGTVKAKHVESENISEMEKNLHSISDLLTENESKLMGLYDENDSLSSVIDKIQETITKIDNIASGGPKLKETDVDFIDKAYSKNDAIEKSILEKLQSESFIFNDLKLNNAHISDGLTAGTIYIESDSILSLGYDLQISSLSTISFFDSEIVMTKDGDIDVHGSLTAENITVTNHSHERVASIDMKGQGTFKGLAIERDHNDSPEALLITPEENKKRNGIELPALETDTNTAGQGIVPPNEKEIILYNSYIKSSSLIYLTSTSGTSDASLRVSKKESCEGDVSSCRPYFSVSINVEEEKGVPFNWLIIN